jgi:DNA-directed RNA polymerase specialized sigma24 family protein
MLAAQADLDSLLPKFVIRDPAALDVFPRVATPMLGKLARRFAPELPVDLVNEIIQETYCLLLNGSRHAFDPVRGTARKFLFGVVLNATQRVRSNYCPPGTRTRKRIFQADGDLNREAEFSPAIVPFDETIHCDARRSVFAEVGRLEAEIDLNTLLRGASTLLVTALAAIYLEGHKVADVARTLGVSRFRIGREIRAFVRQRRGTRKCRVGL